MELGTNQDNNKKKKIIIMVAAILLLVVAAILFFYFRSQIRATTMRILRLEGEVSLEDNGKNKKVKESLRLNDGNALATDIESLVSIGLDDTKIVTMDEKSRAEFSQRGRKLDLHLTAGSLFFEVQKPLEDDETFDIRTSTMVVGIRGTSGWVSVEGDHESLIVTDGTVHVIGINPTTGETKEIDVGAGQRVQTYLYNDRKVDSIMFYLERITERDLPEFVLNRLRENPELLDKVVAQTGWDKPWILGIVKPTPTPTPTPKPKNESDGIGSKNVTPTPASTQEPTKESQKKNTEQEQLEQLLALMQAMITPTPTPTPEVTQSTGQSDDDDDDGDNGGGVTPTGYNYTGDGVTPVTITNINPNYIYEYDPSSDSFYVRSDAGYVSLPLTITYNGTAHTYNTLDDVDIWSGGFAVTSGNLTKTANGDLYDSSTGKVKIDGYRSLEPTPSPSSFGLTETHEDGSGTHVNFDKLSMIDWSNSTVSSEAEMTSSNVRVVKEGADTYDVYEGGAAAPTYNDINLNDLNNYISSHNY